MFMPVTSTSGLPSMIHWAMVRPIPPPVRMPIEFSPAATKKFLSSGASPTIGSRSGVKLSGPQKNFLIPVCSVTGTRAMVFSRYGPIRSQSGGSSPNEKSGGIAVDLPRRADRLEQAEHQAAALLAVVAVGGRVLEHRPGAVDAFDRLGEQVVVLGRLQRDGHPGQLAELARPHARRS